MLEVYLLRYQVAEAHGGSVSEKLKTEIRKLEPKSEHNIWYASLDMLDSTHKT